MGKLTILVVAAVAASLGAMMAVYFGESTGAPASAEIGVSSTGTGPPVAGDTDCDGDVDVSDGLSAFRSVAGLEQLPQNEPCLDIGSLAGSATDFTPFTLHFLADQTAGEFVVGHVVYCGVVHANDRAYSLEVATSNAPELVDANDPGSPLKPGHDGAGWFMVESQGGIETQFNVPNNSAYAFDMQPEGTAGVDQIFRMSSPPKGNESGGGASFTGFVSAHAAGGAVDPFTGDVADDNFCVTIGVTGGVSAEFIEGEVSTTLPVPDGWVLDGDGSDGGVLAGVPH